MIRSLNTAEQAMKIEQVRIDALANNLANANSTGFRQILTNVSQKSDDPTAGGVQMQAGRTAAGRGNWGSQPEMRLEHAVDLRPGAVRSTGRNTDVALLDRGFFAIETDAGERYTRAGSFFLNSEKQLTTPSGELVLGTGGPISLEGESFSIEANGSVIVDGNIVSQLKVVDFADATRLMHEGNNLLKAPVDLAPQAVPAEQIVMAQGHLESSNVNPIDTLVAMIAAQRAFEVQTRVVSAEDEMLEKSVNKLPRVG